jgi:hypothetical protein
MCTVSFIARQRGYLLAMNRDEQRTRPAGRLPHRRTLAGRTVLGPAEPGGGSWFTVNDTGTAFALVNWYSVPAPIQANSVSRGEVVNAVSAQTDAAGAAAVLAALPLNRVNPFRLIGVFPARREVVEWRWNLNALVRVDHLWRAQQFISSGLDEPQAQRVRSRIFRQASRQASAGTLAWLRRLHRSHLPVCGPFSTCMHRPDAATVSYTELSVSATAATLRHLNAAPCEWRSLKPAQTAIHRLELRPAV